MTRQSFHFGCQYRRCYFQITYFLLMFSVILLGYFSSGVKLPRSGKCSALSIGPLMRCGYYPNSCIVSNFTCDGFTDCSDGSDESNATCAKGLVCDDKPKPVCLNGGTCRSVVASATRLPHHECDCIAPFTGAKCSEISTTLSSPTTDSARIPTTSTAVIAGASTVVTSTFSSALSTTVDSARTSTAVGGTSTIVTSKFGPSTQGFTSQTGKKTQTESTSSQTENTTLNINSPSVTIIHTLPNKQQTDESMSNTKSQSSSNTTEYSQTTTSSTEGKTTLPARPPPPPKQTRPVKNIHITTTTQKSSKPKNPKNSSSNIRTTVILIVVFGLIFLIPVAIFIHCRMKKKHSDRLFPQKSKKDDKEILTQNNKTELNNKTQEMTKPKTNHQRNVSISSIQMKEHSNLLGNEMPLDVNMNRPHQPAPPAIRVTYATDDVKNEPPGSSSSYTNTDMTDRPHYPETQMWMPGDGSEETPYFVTGNGPLPVSLV